MEQQNDKPPDVYPSDPDEMAVRVQDILDRHRKAEKQLVFAYCRQQARFARARDILDGLSEKFGAWMRKTVASDRNATGNSTRRRYDH